MEMQSDTKIVCSTRFNDIALPAYNGWCIHVLCLSGEASFTYNGRAFVMRKNDVVIITQPQLVKDIRQSHDLQVEIVIGSLQFLHHQLPANNFSIGGSISLYKDPVIPVSDDETALLLSDMRRIKERLADTSHPFRQELLGSLSLTMMYDLFAFHARRSESVVSTERTTSVVNQFVTLLEGGESRRYREVRHYADMMHITPKYLSDTVKRKTGQSAMGFIDRYTIPIVKNYLDNPQLSITQISDAMNFASVSYFSRYVTKHFGMSPKVYRTALLPKR
ncbi:MAG: helix-turn-helix domain-containing protein [Prevotellaceae bacterium]|nr:helix-turn-helix domain-containing protein [Prevotella sp.]MDD7257008.1 helix-turn-helix domain-containing protein [Prevotellaceae bacterium]MDY6130269.1 helix-turn-helix domain-containing protein [Prevotella sp.]